MNCRKKKEFQLSKINNTTNLWQTQQTNTNPNNKQPASPLRTISNICIFNFRATAVPPYQSIVKISASNFFSVRHTPHTTKFALRPSTLQHASNPTPIEFTGLQPFPSDTKDCVTRELGHQRKEQGSSIQG